MRLFSKLMPQRQPERAETNPIKIDSASMKYYLYCQVLSGTDEHFESAPACRRAWETLQKQMALVPTGVVELESQQLDNIGQSHASGVVVNHREIMEVPSFYIDKVTVSNLDFFAFVKAGGYHAMELWPQEVWSHVTQFTDQTGEPGPLWWKHGKPLRELNEHPVVGVSWYEAAAYANWVGKHLPTSAQWQRAATWHTAQQGKWGGDRYPWGNTFESDCAHTWGSRPAGTCPVHRYSNGCTPNGISQLIGNVWEWVSDEFAPQGPENDEMRPWGEIRGGAFDTYLAIQATCQFRSAQQKLWREHNVGFRCAVNANELTRIPEII